MFFEGWKVWRIGNRDAGVAQMRRGVSKFAEQKFVVTDGLFKTALAEAEAESGEIGAALSTIDSAIAESERTGQRTFDAEVHRTRGEILLKQDAANPAPAEDAFLAAIAIAQAQKARSFELRAALALAKLYGATGRDADAHAVLGPALEGFAPTPEFPEIAEAQALFDALAQTDEVKAATASRKQRVQLQIAYGNALIAARGYGAPETKAAFERARELAAEIENPKERFSAIYGLWVGSYIRSELGPMRELAAAFLRDAASPSGLPEASVAHRVNGITNWFAGEFVEARAHHERALAIFDPSRDGDLAFRFGHDPGVGAMACMSLTLWPLGEIDRARQLVEDMTVRLTQISHIGTVAFGNMHAALLEMMRRSQDFAQTARLAKTLAGLARDHDLQHWRAESIFLEGLAAWQAGDRNAGLAQMRRGVAQRHEQNIIHFHGILGTALAEAEAEAGEIDGALATLAQALTQSELTGERCYDAETYRIRGEILLKKDASNPAAAEEAFLAAIAIAQAQKARSFELRAALALAKLYCATGRDADAHAVLGRALEGFAPTPEFPEIGEARALLATLAWSDPVRAASAMRWAPATASDSEPRPR
jgi:predicted ATPase